MFRELVDAVQVTNKVLVVRCPHQRVYIIFIARTRPGRLFIAYLLHTRFVWRPKWYFGFSIEPLLVQKCKFSSFVSIQIRSRIEKAFDCNGFTIYAHYMTHRKTRKGIRYLIEGVSWHEFKLVFCICGTRSNRMHEFQIELFLL